MAAPYQQQQQDQIYTQSTGTTNLNEVPAPTYNEKPPPAHQPSYHQDSQAPQPIYTHPQDTTSQIHQGQGQPGVYQDPALQHQQYGQQSPAIQPDVHYQQQPQQGTGPPPDFYQPKQEPVQPQQNQQPQTQQGGQNVMPLDRLQRYPDIAHCPVCARDQRTRIEHTSGGMTHITALAACFIACLGCIPYLIDSLKDVEHYCGSCGALLAVWHRSGHTEVLAGRGGPAPVKPGPNGAVKPAGAPGAPVAGGKPNYA